MPITQEPPGRPAAAPPPPQASLHADDEAPPPAQQRGRLVGVIIGGLVATTFVMVAFIWYRWYPVREPTTAVIVAGDATYDGTVVTVTGTPTPITTRLDPGNNYVAPVLLEPGIYWVTAERNGQVVLRQRVEVKRFLGVRFTLNDPSRPTPTGAGPSTRPTTP